MKRENPEKILAREIDGKTIHYVWNHAMAEEFRLSLDQREELEAGKEIKKRIDSAFGEMLAKFYLVEYDPETNTYQNVRAGRSMHRVVCPKCGGSGYLTISEEGEIKPQGNKRRFHHPTATQSGG